MRHPLEPAFRGKSTHPPKGLPEPPASVMGAGAISASQQALPATPSWLAPAAIILFGIILRLFYLNHQGSDFDEAFSIASVHLPMRDMMRTLIADYVHPPLHYLVLRGWLDLFGFGVVQARLLSVVFSAAALCMLYSLARYLFDRKVALLATLFLAISQLSIAFAQEARPYAQFLFLFLCTTYLFVRALRERRAVLWWSFIGAGILLIYTHYFGVLALLALLCHALLYRRDRLRPGWLLGGALVGALSYLPWLTSGVVHAAATSPKTFSGVNSYWAVHWSTFLTAVNFFNNGKPAGLLNSAPAWTFVVGGLLFTAPILLLARRFLRHGNGGGADEREREGIVLGVLLALLPVFGAMGLGLLHLQYNVRYVSFCAAAYYILTAVGIQNLNSRALRLTIIAGLCAYSLFSLRGVYFVPSKEDFRDALAYVEQNRQQGDCGVFLPNYTVPDQWSIEERSPLFRVLGASDLSSGVTSCGRVWAISWSGFGNSWGWNKAKLDAQPLAAADTKVNQKDYWWVSVALYSRDSR